MSTNSKIEWCGATWNSVAGCTRCSPGCDHCYAVPQTYSCERMGLTKYAGLTVLNRAGDRHFNGVLRPVPEALGLPLEWKQPKLVFVNSMSDLFHKEVPAEYIRRVFGVMRRASWHTFQVLTKRAERLADVDPRLDWPPNVWMGVSVESADYAGRVDHLLRTGARVKFLSVEPLLAPVGKLDLAGIDWVIVGGESGPRARACDLAWVRDVVRQCRAAGVAVFVKQLGADPRSDDPAEPFGVRDRKGGDMAEWPADLRVRAYPAGAAGPADRDRAFRAMPAELQRVARRCKALLAGSGGDGLEALCRVGAEFLLATGDPDHPPAAAQLAAFLGREPFELYSLGLIGMNFTAAEIRSLAAARTADGRPLTAAHAAILAEVGEAADRDRLLALTLAESPAPEELARWAAAAGGDPTTARKICSVLGHLWPPPLPPTD